MTESYRPPPDQKGLLLFISGPSGVGKSTICRALAAQLPAEFALSATTRMGKPQDQWGKRYLFVNANDFERHIDQGDFLEYAQVFGHWYGTLKAPVIESLNAGKKVLLEIDVQGGQQIKVMFPHAVGILILPPSEESLAQRLTSRGRDDPATITTRLAQAKMEISAARNSGAYSLEVVNQVVETTIERIKEFVQGPRPKSG